MTKKESKPFRKTCLWTDFDDNFTFAVVEDFLEDVQDVMEEEKISAKELGKKIGVSEKKLKALFDNPKDISMVLAVKIVRALNKKVCLLLYDDGEDSSPVFPEIFRKSWKTCGKPITGWDLEELATEKRHPTKRIKKLTEELLACKKQ